MSRVFSTISVQIAVVLLGAPALADPVPALIPLPASIVRTDGNFTVSADTTIAATDPGATTAARLLVDRVKIDRGIALSVAATGPIRIDRDASIRGEEAYRLTVDPAGIRIAASGDAGLVHGAMTLVQLLSPDRAYGRPVAVPAMVIDDAPRFRWRGVTFPASQPTVPPPPPGSAHLPRSHNRPRSDGSRRASALRAACRPSSGTTRRYPDTSPPAPDRTA